jgi:hypothetical protein
VALVKKLLDSFATRFVVLLLPSKIFLVGLPTLPKTTPRNELSQESSGELRPTANNVSNKTPSVKVSWLTPKVTKAL